jgi:hypothetical protein
MEEGTVISFSPPDCSLNLLPFTHFVIVIYIFSVIYQL